MLSVTMSDIRKNIESANNNRICSPECKEILTEKIAQYIRDDLNELLLIPGMN